MEVISSCELWIKNFFVKLGELLTWQNFPKVAFSSWDTSALKEEEKIKFHDTVEELGNHAYVEAITQLNIKVLRVERRITC